MPRTSTSSETLTKISNALEALKQDLSYAEFRKFDVREFPKRFSITNTFPTILRNLKVIEPNPTKRGEVRLTPKMLTLTPKAVVKSINSYQKQSRKRTLAITKRLGLLYSNKAPKTPTPTTTDLSLDTLIVALKEKVKKEVMSELLSSLTK